MSILKKLFGGSKPSNPKPSPSAEEPKNPAEDPNMIRVMDGYGRELFITREQWRENVLIGNLEKNWDSADQLSGLIIQSLQDGFFEDLVRPAERLLELENGDERSTVLLAIVYLKVTRLEDSERVLKEYISRNGESGIVLTNLAKVYAEHNEDERALATLWHALELDPNQDNGMGWYEVICRDKGGLDGGIEALRRIAALPNSWRAQLWLARAELQAGRLTNTITLYQEAIARSGRPVPADLLMQMSGDLGNAGRLHEILQLAMPEFEPRTHGLQVGNNLIKANVDLGHLEAARAIVDQLYPLNRPDWRETLSYWDTEIAKAGVTAKNAGVGSPIEVAMLLGEGPIWLKPGSPASELFPPRPTEGRVICFLGSTAEVQNPASEVELQLADGPGRLSRALPLFLAEQVELKSGARARTLVPWVSAPGSGFVLSAQPWTDEDAVGYAKQSDIVADYLVLTHLIANMDPWTIRLRIIRLSDSKCVKEASVSFAIADSTDALLKLTRDFLEALSQEASLKISATPQGYIFPSGPTFPSYLIRLEQLLAVRCGTSEENGAPSLNGERDIIGGTLALCLDVPKSVNARLLLAQTLLSMKIVRPNIPKEFADRIALLQKEHALPPAAHNVTQAMFEEAFAH